MILTLFIVLLGLAGYGFFLGKNRSLAMAGDAHLHSQPSYYGYYVALWTGLPALLLILLWAMFGSALIEAQVLNTVPQDVLALPPERLELFMRDVVALAEGGLPSQVTPAHEEAAQTYKRWTSLTGWALVVVILGAAILSLTYARQKIAPSFRARNQVETVIKMALILCSVIAILTTIGIVISLLFESLRFFGKVSLTEFLFGLQWSPQTALRAEQVGQSGSFGAVPLFTGTLLITVLAMIVAVPLGLLSAVYLSEYASPQVRAYAKPLLEILAGIPTVVYGFFALLTVAPFVRVAVTALSSSLGLELDVPAQSALAAGIVMGVMIIPFISSLSDDVINAVPQSLRDGSYAIGATKSETIMQVILPAALPGIVGAVLLAISRAIGETMIVVMAAGRAANLTANPLEAVTTITVQIVTLLTGDQEFDSAKTLAAFALGLVLFCVTLVLNVVALRVVQTYREKYD